MSTLSIEEQFKSPEVINLLKKLELQLNNLNESFTFDNLESEIRSLSDVDFYNTCLVKRIISNANEQANPFASTAKATPSNTAINLNFGGKNAFVKGAAKGAAKAADSEVTTSGASTAEIDDVIASAGEAPVAGSGGVLGMLKSLWNSLTEGGSAIGILHLVLDFIGLVGDAFAVVGIPIGMVADFINAMIYFYRGKNILGIISLIAMIPFGGDVLKGFKGIAKNFDGPFKNIFKSGSGKQIAEESAEVLMKQKGKGFSKSKRFLEYIKKSAAKIGAVIANAVKFLFESVLAKAVGWIPFIGKHLKAFFLKIAKKGKIVADNLTSFAKHVDAPIAKKITKEAAKNFKAIDVALKGGGTVVKEGGELVIKKGGKVINKIPINELAKFSNISKKFPDGPMKSMLKTSDDVAEYYVFLGKTTKSTNKWFKTIGDTSVLGGPLKVRDWKLFIGKCIVKVLGSSGDALSDFEEDGLSDVVTTQDLNKLMDKHKYNEMKRKGSVIDVPYIDQMMRDRPETEDIDESKLADAFTKHLNYNAERMGLPSFDSYVYAKAKNDREEELVKIYTENAISDKEYNKLVGIKSGDGVDVFESKYVNSTCNIFNMGNGKLKYIKPF